jgi:hypothetical protein
MLILCCSADLFGIKGFVVVVDVAQQITGRYLIDCFSACVYSPKIGIT